MAFISFLPNWWRSTASLNRSCGLERNLWLGLKTRKTLTPVTDRIRMQKQVSFISCLCSAGDYSNLTSNWDLDFQQFWKQDKGTIIVLVLFLSLFTVVSLCPKRWSWFLNCCLPIHDLLDCSSCTITPHTSRIGLGLDSTPWQISKKSLLKVTWQDVDCCFLVWLYQCYSICLTYLHSLALFPAEIIYVVLYSLHGEATKTVLSRQSKHWNILHWVILQLTYVTFIPQMISVSAVFVT